MPLCNSASTDFRPCTLVFRPHKMPPEIFNPNPTIFRTEKVSSSRLAQKKSLWIDDEEDTDIDEENNEVEAIDQDEIFGGHLMP